MPILLPVHKDAANLTAVTALVTNTSYFLYLGHHAAVTSVDIVYRITTLAATITWAEVGIFKGTPVANGAASLTRLGFTDVSGVVNSAGIKKTTVTLSGYGGERADLWVAFGCQATVVMVMRGMLADDIQTGCVQQFSGRISTMSNPSTTSLSSATLVPPWCAVSL